MSPRKTRKSKALTPALALGAASRAGARRLRRLVRRRLVGRARARRRPARPRKAARCRWRTSREPSSLDPAVAWNVIDWQIEHAIYQGMLQYAPKPGDAGNALVPCLATEVPTVAERRHLRPTA